MGVKRSVTEYANRVFAELLSSMFKGINFKGRFRVEGELDQWRVETKELWNIKKGNKEQTYSLYFDDEHMCSFTQADSVKRVTKMFLEGFTEAYEDKRIYLNTGLKEQEEAKIKTEEKIRREKEKIEMEQDLKKLSPEEKSIAREVLENPLDESA